MPGGACDSRVVGRVPPMRCNPEARAGGANLTGTLWVIARCASRSRGRRRLAAAHTWARSSALAHALCWRCGRGAAAGAYCADHDRAKPTTAPRRDYSPQRKRDRSGAHTGRDPYLRGCPTLPRKFNLRASPSDRVRYGSCHIAGASNEALSERAQRPPLDGDDARCCALRGSLHW